jgi:hypothetical protein
MHNTGQMLMVLGALILFSLAFPSLNRTLLDTDQTLMTTNAELTAISLAQKILAEAGCKAYDQICLTSHPTLASQMTAVGSLGKESGETYPNFNDVDDYNNLTLNDSTTLPSVRFTVTGTVTYINPTNPSETMSSQTFVKRIRVTVTGPYLVDPASKAALSIQMEQLYAFF